MSSEKLASNPIWDELALGELLNDVQGIQANLLGENQKKLRSRIDPLQKREKVVQSSAFGMLMNRYNIQKADPVKKIKRDTLDRLANPLSKHMSPTKPIDTQLQKKPISNMKPMKITTNQKDQPIQFEPGRSMKPKKNFFLTEADNSHDDAANVVVDDNLVTPGYEMGLNLMKKYEALNLSNNPGVPIRRKSKVAKVKLSRLPDKATKEQSRIRSASNIYLPKDKEKDTGVERKNGNKSTISGRDKGRVSSRAVRTSKSAPQLLRPPPIPANRRDRLEAIRPDRSTSMSNNNSSNNNVGMSSKRGSQARLRPMDNNWVAGDGESKGEPNMASKGKSSQWEAVRGYKGKKQDETKVLLDFVGFACPSYRQQEKAQTPLEPIKESTKQRSVLPKKGNLDAASVADSSRGKPKVSYQMADDVIRGANAHTATGTSSNASLAASSEASRRNFRHRGTEASTVDPGPGTETGPTLPPLPISPILSPTKSKMKITSLSPSFIKSNATVSITSFGAIGGSPLPMASGEDEENHEPKLDGDMLVLDEYDPEKRPSLSSEVVSDALRRVQELSKQKPQPRAQQAGMGTGMGIGSVSGAGQGVGQARPPTQPSLASQLAAHARRITSQLATAQQLTSQYRELADDGLSFAAVAAERERGRDRDRNMTLARGPVLPPISHNSYSATDDIDDGVEEF